MRIITSILAMLMGVVGAIIGIATLGGLGVAAFQPERVINFAGGHIIQNFNFIQTEASEIQESINILSSDAFTDIVNEVNQLANTPIEESIDTTALIQRIEQDIEAPLADVQTYLEKFLSSSDNMSVVLDLISNFTSESLDAIFAERNDEQQLNTRLQDLQQQFTASKAALQNARSSNELPLQNLQALNEVSRFSRDASQSVQSLKDNFSTLNTELNQGSLFTIPSHLQRYALITLGAFVLLIWWATWAQWALMRSGWRGLFNRD